MKPITILILILLPFSGFSKSELTNQQQQWLQKPDLCFTENKGQVHDQHGNARCDIQYKIRASKGLNIFVGNGQLHYQFARPLTTPHIGGHGLLTDECSEQQPALFEMYRLDVTLEGANRQAVVVADEKQDYYAHHYNGTGAYKSTTHTYARITYKDIYPNIDWVLYIKKNQLEYDFVIRPGGNVKDIKIRYDGASEIKESGDAVTVITSFGTVTENKLYSYKKDGERVASTFALNNNTLSFNIDNYDETVVIDPALVWSTYFGGNDLDVAQAISYDGFNSVYIGGTTHSTSDMATTGSHQDTLGGNYDAFLAKFTTGGTLRWATYFGRIGDEYGRAIAADARGNILMTGSTTSADSMATTGAYDTTYGGGGDAFLVKFDSTGSLKWANYFGANSVEVGYGVSCGDNNSVYLAGSTGSTFSIATMGAHQFTPGSVKDAFLAKYDSSGILKWATYYGGGRDDEANDVKFIGGNVYLTGTTESTDSMSTPGAYQPSGGGTFPDAFLAQFGSDGALHWGTYYGGSSYDQGFKVAAFGANSVYIAGYTTSADSIATSGSYQSAFGGSVDCYLAKFNNLGGLVWSTYYGGGSQDWAMGLACDSAGNICMTGETMSNDSIATPGADRTVHIVGIDAFVAKFSSAGTRRWATYFGGSGPDWGYGIDCDKSGNIYVTGDARSSDSIATAGAYSTTLNGAADAFLTKFGNPTLEIEEAEARGIIADVWPNPVKDKLYFRPHAALVQGSIIVTDLTGKQIVTQKMDLNNTAGVNVGSLSPGIYLYHIYSDGSRVNTGKFVKE
jgi:hypothetical protein